MTCCALPTPTRVSTNGRCGVAVVGGAVARGAVVAGAVVGGAVVVVGATIVVVVVLADVVVVARGFAVELVVAARCVELPHPASAITHASAPKRTGNRRGIRSVAYAQCLDAFSAARR